MVAGQTVEFDVVETEASSGATTSGGAGRGIQPYERLAFTTGMVRRTSTTEYHCHNLGYEPVFEELVFTIRIG